MMELFSFIKKFIRKVGSSEKINSNSKELFAYQASIIMTMRLHAIKSISTFSNHIDFFLKMTWSFRSSITMPEIHYSGKAECK